MNHLRPIIILRLAEATRVVVTSGLVTHENVSALWSNVSGGGIATVLLLMVGAQVLVVLGRGEQEFTLNHYVAEDA